MPSIEEEPTHTHHPMPTRHAESSEQRYQRQAGRLLVDNEKKRREIVELRRDLACALLQQVRASIVVDRVLEAQALSARESCDLLELDRCLLDLNIAIDNWKQDSLGERPDLLDRIAALSRPIPEDP